MKTEKKIPPPSDDKWKVYLIIPYVIVGCPFERGFQGRGLKNDGYKYWEREVKTEIEKEEREMK